MGMFDFLFERKQKKEVLNILDVTSSDPNDGDSITINAQGHVNNLEFTQFERPATEVHRIQTYRQISKAAEIDEVLSDIINETFIFQAGRKAFEIDWFPNNDDLSDQLKERIYDEFCNIYDACNFDDIGAELLLNFYVDGRIPFQKIVDKNNPKKGIRQIIWLDPINVVKVKVVPMRDINTKMIDMNGIDEFYVYTNKQINSSKNLNYIYNNVNDVVEGIRLELDEITYVTSGLTDLNGQTIGYLDKAIIPYNNLKMMEQSMVIFRVVRAPMRRAFYVDVSSLGKGRAEQYISDMRNRFKSKLKYNTETGSWVDQHSIISMMEDYFIPRFSESKTTEIQNIEGQSSQEILEEVNYMQDKLYQALNAPKSRYAEDNNMFLFGKSDQIPRDEYRYKKFIDRLRNRFMLSIDDMLKTQLILKGIISEKDWGTVKRAYFWNYTEDNAFIEYKDAEILNNRIAVVASMSELVEKGYYSNLWIRKMILKQTDEEIEEIDKQVYKERSQLQLPDEVDSGNQDGEDYDDDESSTYDAPDNSNAEYDTSSSSDDAESDTDNADSDTETGGADTESDTDNNDENNK